MSNGTTHRQAESATPVVASATQAEQAAWYNLLAQWRVKAAEFEQAQAWLSSQADYMSTQPPAVQADYRAMLARASTLKARIVQVSGALRAVESWLKGAYSALIEPWERAGVAIKEWLGLGVAPVALIPIAVVAAALAAVAYFLTDFGKYRLRIDEYRRTGKWLPDPGLFGDASNLLMWAALAAAAVFILPRLLKR